MVLTESRSHQNLSSLHGKKSLDESSQTGEIFSGNTALWAPLRLGLIFGGLASTKNMGVDSQFFFQ